MTDAAETYLLSMRNVSLTREVLPIPVCSALISRHSVEWLLNGDEVARETARHVTAYRATIARQFSDDDRLKIIALHDCIAAMPARRAVNYISVLISSKIWFPDRKTRTKLEKMAEQRRITILSMAHAHLAEAKRRAAEQALDHRLQAERSQKTPEQRRAFVDACLRKHGFAKAG